MGHVWFTDCESLFAHWVSPNTKQVDSKRLTIDLSAVQQHIWDNRDDCDEEVDGSRRDYPCWIDTSSILADCLRKTKNSCRLIVTLCIGIFYMTPIEESLVIKAKNRKWRASKKEKDPWQDSDS